jgi:L-iditol 2-dehydrogenase
MKAVVVVAPGSVVVREVVDPPAGPAALIRIERAGLCGTDLKIVRGDVPVRTPRIVGHELIGRVAAPGERGLVPEGARVLVDPSVACGRCHACRRDRPHLCVHGALMGRDVDGGCAELAVVAEERLHPVPDEVSDDAAALLQVLATCVHGQERVEVFPGQPAAVVGLGVAGLLHLQLLRARGADPVIGVTRSRWKREPAAGMGATAVVTPEEAEEAVADLTGGRGADISVECAGTPHTLRQSMRLAGAGGTVLVFGTTAPHADAMPTYEWYYKELTIVNSRAARPRDFERAIALAVGGGSGPLTLAPLVTAAYPLDRARAAFDACADPAQLKVVVDVARRAAPSSGEVNP